jgi:flavorubredoxin
MTTKIDEIADGVFRLSTFVPEIAPPAGFTFNQFLVLGDEPLMFHTGLRKMFPVNREVLCRIISPEKLRWIAFGHYEADECGAMNEWLAIAPNAQVAHGQTGCLVSLNDMADRAPRVLADGEIIELGRGKRVSYIDTPHTPHGWDAGVMIEESTGTLLCGDLFTQLGNGPALTQGDIVGPAIAAEDLFKYSALNPDMGATIRGLAKLAPRTLALMHGPSFTGDGGGALRALADDYERRSQPPDGDGGEPSGVNHVMRCPLCVKSGHMQCKTPCPLYPRKRTCAAHKPMSESRHVQCTRPCPLYPQ